LPFYGKAKAIAFALEFIQIAIWWIRAVDFICKVIFFIRILPIARFD